MEAAELPEWEGSLIDEAIRAAERRLEDEHLRAARRAIQLGREQGYHRLALAIDRPHTGGPGPGQMSFFPTEPTLFDQEAG